MVPSPFFYTVVAGLSTGLGGVLAAAVRPSRRALDACMGFAGGVMLAISLADLAPEALAFTAAGCPRRARARRSA